MNFSQPVSDDTILGSTFMYPSNIRAVDQRKLINEVMNETREPHAKGARDASLRGIDWIKPTKGPSGLFDGIYVQCTHQFG